MTDFIEIFSEDEIKSKVEEIGQKISNDYKDKGLILMGVLKGSFMFLADLARAVTIDHKIDLIGASSYIGSKSSGTIKIYKEPDLDLENKDILLVEDIVDTGRTLVALIDYLESFKPNSLKICTLIDKHERRELQIDVDYACFSLEKGFIVGYGLDYNEKYRNLPAIYNLNF